MKHLGRNILSLITSRVISGVILFLVYTRLVQYLGAEAAGQFGLLSSYLTVFNFFVDLGISQLVIKRMSEDRTHAAKYLSNYFFLQAALALMFMLIMDGFVFFADYPGFLKNALYITSIGLFLSSIALPFRTVIISFQKLTITAKVNFINAIINAGMMALAIYLRQNVFYLAFIAGVISIFDLLVYWTYVHRKLAKFEFKIDMQFIKQLLISGLPFTLLTLFSIYNRIDGLILPHLRSFTENGYYSAAYKLWDTLAFFPAIVGITLYPFFAESLSRKFMDQVKIGLETYTRYMIAIAVPMSVGAFLLAQPLTLALFGHEFMPAAPALWILVLAVSILFIYSPANSLMISEQTKVATKITGFNLLFNLIANVIFIPKYGFVAAAVITVISETIQMLGYAYVINKRIVNYTFFRHFIKPFLATASMAIAIKFFDLGSVWLSVLLGGAVYSVALLGLKFFHREDWELFKHAANFRQPTATEEHLP